MFYTQSQDPRMVRLQGRLARVPRWGWIAVMVGIMVPIAVLGIAILAVGLMAGAAVLAAVIVVTTVLATVQRVAHRRALRLEAKRNTIVVSNVRVIDSRQLNS